MQTGSRLTSDTNSVARQFSALVRFIAIALVISNTSTTFAQTISGRVIGITDGDTFTLLTDELDQVKIRVAEIDAPERGQPYGSRSQEALSRLIFKQEVSIDVQVVDRYGRPVGRPIVGNTDVTAEMVNIGAAWVYRTYSDDEALYELERNARAAGRGIWGLSEYEQVPPWDWRKGTRPSTGQTSRSGQSSNAADFSCGSKKYCKQMVSCEEAMFHLQQCGLNRLDGDGDGVPCEALCR
jgi:endonuclease YncB( thermonuclease family)